MIRHEVVKLRGTIHSLAISEVMSTNSSGNKWMGSLPFSHNRDD